MAILSRFLTWAVFAFVPVAATALAVAADMAEMNRAVGRVRQDWEHAKYQVRHL